MTAAAQRRIRVRGIVQGVGFRPFVFRLAHELRLDGAVWNDGEGVVIAAAGASAVLDEFERRLAGEAPPAARVEAVESVAQERPAAPLPAGFRIARSGTEGSRRMVLPPDLAICADCARELHDPGDRRHRYPFINCTNCGPRYSIVEALPYDRSTTTMREFTMCADCAHEFGDPGDRRFHAQPVACPACGPRLQFLAQDGSAAAGGDAASLDAAADAVLAGRVVAVKGLGGFHLVCDATNEDSVRRLRERKARDEKPLALMARDLAMAETLCVLTASERGWLRSPAAPIVLAQRRMETGIAPAVAPGLRRLGIMLPYTPLHLLLLERVQRPIVATSGNLSDEPICVSTGEAIDRLRGVADAFLTHNRGIARAVDDSVVQRVGTGRMMVLRRARGFAPAPIPLRTTGGPVIGAGAHLKSTITVAWDGQAVVSAHLGDLSTAAACDGYLRARDLLLSLLEVGPAAVACDLHPDYFSTRQAGIMPATPVIPVQHHHAHVLAVAAEHGLERERLLGFAWDGTGLGTDGTIWGGELLLVKGAGFTRAGHLLPFTLPGGEAAVRDVRRCALGLLWKRFGSRLAERGDLRRILGFEDGEWRGLLALLAKDVSCPVTTSAGRLFDGVAALCGVRRNASFEGQAAMLLEETASESCRNENYPLPLLLPESGVVVLDWRPMLDAILADIAHQIPTGDISLRFHRALAASVVGAARRIGVPTVVLCGGCFQNRLLLHECRAGLEAAGHVVLLPRELPPGDGAVSFGQAVAAELVRSECANEIP